MTAHTPGGPVRVLDRNTGRIVDAAGKVICNAKTAEWEARIVACVNACEGMADPELDLAALRVRAGWREDVAALRAQRDELARLLCDLLPVFDNDSMRTLALVYRDRITAAERALASLGDAHQCGGQP